QLDDLFRPADRDRSARDLHGHGIGTGEELVPGLHVLTVVVVSDVALTAGEFLPDLRLQRAHRDEPAGMDPSDGQLELDLLDFRPGEYHLVMKLHLAVLLLGEEQVSEVLPQRPDRYDLAEPFDLPWRHVENLDHAITGVESEPVTTGADDLFNCHRGHADSSFAPRDGRIPCGRF